MTGAAAGSSPLLVLAKVLAQVRSVCKILHSALLLGRRSVRFRLSPLMHERVSYPIRGYDIFYAEFTGKSYPVVTKDKNFSLKNLTY